MEERALIFNHIDAKAKYMGFTMLEIIVLALVIISGFAFNSMIMACFGCFGSVILLRYIMHLLKTSAFKRMVFFFFSSALAVHKKRINIYARYYF